MSYFPRDGSKVARLLDALRSQFPGECTSQDLERLTGINKAHVAGLLTVPAINGAVRKRYQTLDKGGRQLFWSLGDGTPPPNEPDPKPNGADLDAATVEEDDTESAAAFACALYNDGELVLVLRDGSSHTLAVDDTLTLARYLHGVRELLAGEHHKTPQEALG